MEAGSTVPIYDGSVLLAKPEHGPVCIRAEVKGTQLYTFISTASALTVINKALADHLVYVALITCPGAFFTGKHSKPSWFMTWLSQSAG